MAALGLAEGFLGEHIVADLPIVAIDTETTGRDPASDRVVEVACVRWERGEIVLRKTWLVNPGRPIPKEAFDVHGISDETVKDAPTFDAIVPELLEALAGAIPLAYNAEFDRKQLSSELEPSPRRSRSAPGRGAHASSPRHRRRRSGAAGLRPVSRRLPATTSLRRASQRTAPPRALFRSRTCTLARLGFWITCGRAPPALSRAAAAPSLIEGCGSSCST